jgi:hypothetical protein
VSSTGYSLAQMTAIDTGDVAGWLTRGQRDLEQSGFGTLAVDRETGSVLDLSATLVVGGKPRGASLTVYKNYGRVRIAGDGDAGAATRLESLLADQLELTVATRVAKPGLAAAVTQATPGLAAPLERAMSRTTELDKLLRG